MTDHRRRAEELGRYFDWEKDTEQVREIASALKEVEEETWKRAVGCVEKTHDPDYVGEWGAGTEFGIDKALEALREEARKEGV